MTIGFRAGEIASILTDLRGVLHFPLDKLAEPTLPATKMCRYPPIRRDLGRSGPHDEAQNTQ